MRAIRRLNGSRGFDLDHRPGVVLECTLAIMFDDNGVRMMGVHQWAAEQIEAALAQGHEQGHDELMALRALLSAVVERSKGCRSPGDLAQELEFLASNLDEDRDYAFMRP